LLHNSLKSNELNYDDDGILVSVPSVAAAAARDDQAVGYVIHTALVDGL
jgi:hypothetical protein